jgi:uncharacterized protein (TIRG00374 family)
LDRFERRILAGVVFGVVVYAGLLVWSDVETLAGHIRSFPVQAFLVALGLTAVNYLLRFAKWEVYLRGLGHRLPWAESAHIFVAGMVMSVTPGKVGEVIKSLLLRESREIPAARTAPIVVAERVTDLLGMAMMAGIGVVTFEFGRAAFALTVVGLAVAVFLLNQREWMTWAIEAMEGVPVVGRFQPKLAEAYDSLAQLVSWRILAGTTLLSALAWSFEGVALWWLIEAVEGAETTLLLAFFIYAIATILGSVSFLPGGLGVTEGVMVLALLRFGVMDARSQAVLVTYLIRFATLWFGVLLGLLALLRFRMVYGDSADS